MSVCVCVCTRTRAHTHAQRERERERDTHTHTHIDVTEVEEDIMFMAHYMGRKRSYVSSLRQHQAVVSCFFLSLPFSFSFSLLSPRRKEILQIIMLEKITIVSESHVI
jgi:hypothetical protein